MKDFFENNKDIGIFILRIGIGVAFTFIYGLMKIEGGPELWTMIGASMSNLVINFAPTFWGFMAAITEFGGGILLIIGLFTRPAALFLAFVMLVATLHHLSLQDQWYNVISPVKMFAVFIALLFTGAGRYSIDAVISKKKA
jgi:putative oxidoreductase